MGCRPPSQLWRADTRGCFGRSGHASTSRPWGCRVRTRVHLPSLGVSGQDTRPPPVPGREGVCSREGHRDLPKDTDTAPEGQGRRPTLFHSQHKGLTHNKSGEE
ncbi:unnamed protein product [Rangifer tarandus platyrhynchus]|uniref:Uncharacterized protein n=1 Tax=Rangifer tarandus platyrhynchus TaxID=3082113 RepID=A0ACB1MJZ2_RANTA